MTVGIREVQLDRPERANALDAMAVDHLLEEVTRAAENGTRVLVLRGRGRHFCAGFDMSGALDQSQGDLLLRFVRIEQLLQRLWAAPFVTVACVAGSAIGAGADLVAACTHRLLDPGAHLRFPGFRFGVALGTRRLARQVGTQAARDLLLSSHQIDAATAVDIGLGSRLVDADDFDTAVAELAHDSANLDRAATASLLTRTSPPADDDADMAALVNSLTRPGLHNRLASYLGNSRG